MFHEMIRVLMAVLFMIGPTGFSSNASEEEVDFKKFNPPDFSGPEEDAEQFYYVDTFQMNSITHLKGFENSKIIKGIEDGAAYWIEVPEKWNGKLVLYAHGYRGTGSRLTVTAPPFRKELLKEGYAWAASSYSTNRYDIKTGVKDTHKLNRLFQRHAAKPERTYMMGHSMGGHVTGVYAEKYGNVDGAVPMCGVMGDLELFNFFTAHGLAAQALAGIKKENQRFPADDDFDKKTLPELRKKLGNGTKKDPYTGATVFKTLTPAGIKLSAVTENLSGGKRPLFDFAYRHLFNDFLLRRFPEDPFYDVASSNVINTADTVYQFDSAPAISEEEQKFNNSVLRVSFNPQTKNSGQLPGIPKVTGNLRVPTITLHTLGDLYVPISMEQIYRQRAMDHGKSDLLVTRAIRGIGHCEFKPQEEIQALLDLDKWVEEGKAPEGDDILDRETVADERFGLKFTSELRDYDPLKHKIRAAD